MPPKYKICPYCRAARALDSRFCSQCADALDESTHSSGFYKNKNTIVIAALSAASVVLLVVAASIAGLAGGLKSTSSANKPPSNRAATSSASASLSNSPGAKQEKSNAALLTRPDAKASATPAETPETPSELDSPDKDAAAVDDREAPATRSRSSDGRDYDADDETPLAARAYITGPRGACYYLSGAGRKVYVDHDFCGGGGEARPRGGAGREDSCPRGGCYYIDSGGRKSYVDRSLCD
jgi:hypothetical protein